LAAKPSKNQGYPSIFQVSKIPQLFCQVQAINLPKNMKGGKQCKGHLQWSGGISFGFITANAIKLTLICWQSAKLSAFSQLQAKTVKAYHHNEPTGASTTSLQHHS
jgi:hypothetical protein